MKKQKQFQQILIKKANCKTKKFYILLSFLLYAILLLIAVSSYCCVIKYKAKQKHLLSFKVINSELKKVMYL